LKAEEFVSFRKRMGKTQKEMAELLGVSIKAVCSYEQGWRNVPAHVERQSFFLFYQKEGLAEKLKPCWEILSCPPEFRLKCPAWEFKAGLLCWFINGNICNGVPHKNWAEKIEICKKCRAFPSDIKTASLSGDWSGGKRPTAS